VDAGRGFFRFAGCPVLSEKVTHPDNQIEIIKQHMKEPGSRLPILCLDDRAGRPVYSCLKPFAFRLEPVFI
jgi:hypothetical protein